MPLHIPAERLSSPSQVLTMLPTRANPGSQLYEADVPYENGAMVSVVYVMRPLAGTDRPEHWRAALRKDYPLHPSTKLSAFH